MQLLEMVERNELNRSLLTLLDENIANAHEGNQVLLETPVHVVQIEFNIALLCFYFFGGGGGGGVAGGGGWELEKSRYPSQLCTLPCYTYKHFTIE